MAGTRIQICAAPRAQPCAIVAAENVGIGGERELLANRLAYVHGRGRVRQRIHAGIIGRVGVAAEEYVGAGLNRLAHRREAPAALGGHRRPDVASPEILPIGRGLKAAGNVDRLDQREAQPFKERISGRKPRVRLDRTAVEVSNVNPKHSPLT